MKFSSSRSSRGGRSRTSRETAAVPGVSSSGGLSRRGRLANAIAHLTNRSNPPSRSRPRVADRRLQSETLETRQLLAGPELVGIQTNNGDLLVDGTVLSVSPRELVFRFDDSTNLDVSTLDAIRLTRSGDDGVFEQATAISNLGLDNNVRLQFRSRVGGEIGNGIELVFTNQARGGSSLPIVNVDGSTINVSLNSTPGLETQITDLQAVFNPLSPNANPAASSLVEVISVTGRPSDNLGGLVANGTTVTLLGANAAQATSDLGTAGIPAQDQVEVRFVSQLTGADGLDTRIQFVNQSFGGPAAPVIFTNGSVIEVRLNATPGFESTTAELVAQFNLDEDASALVTAIQQDGPGETILGGRTIAPVILGGVSDVAVQPGFVGLGDSPNEVVFRFSEALPDDVYQVNILGTGLQALLTTDGESFEAGRTLSTQFAVDLGPQVVAVVPEPVRRNSAGLVTGVSRGQIDVHFSEQVSESSAENTALYQLIFGRGTVNNNDDLVVTPTSVNYNSSTNIATLQFNQPLGLIDSGAARLRIGSSVDSPAPPTEFAFAPGGNAAGIEPGDTFATAVDLEALPTPFQIDATGVTSAIIDAEILNESPFNFQLPGPDSAGVRNTRPEDPSRISPFNPVPLGFVRGGPDAIDGISTLSYDFAGTFLGDDPNSGGSNLISFANTITEIQKQRVREAFELFSQYLGVNFVEQQSDQSTSDFTIAVGDLRGANPNIVSGEGGLAVVLGNRDGSLIGDQNLAVLDFQDFDESTDDQFGGEFSRGALFAVGQLLGYGFADDLPQPVTQSTSFVLNPGTDTEPLFPAPADIVNGQFLFRPDSTDIDLYRFSLPVGGTFQAETLAQRLTQSSTLDTTIRLYQAVGADFVEIAANDDYFSDDSLIQLDLTAGDYVLGVSSTGNDSYNPLVRDSGFGGTTQGQYQLRLEFVPTVTDGIVDVAVDANNDGDFDDAGDLPATLLDGDNDGQPGGVFDFFFVPSETNNTLYVDKAGVNVGGLIGSLTNPFTEIDQALAAAQPGETVYVLGNGGADGNFATLEDNLPYEIGTASNQLPLPDGSNLVVPQGVQLVIDSAAILKFGRAGITVGSDSPTIDSSGASLQVLGTPSILLGGELLRDADGQVVPGNVFFTSINDTTIGNAGTVNSSTAAQPGDYGGIAFRGAIDSSDSSREFSEDAGVFVNHIQFADIRFGGGVVSSAGQSEVIAPIDIDVTRPTILNSVITNSAGAAISATPQSFAESSFTTPNFQGDSPFTLDYDRVGPEISGNRLINNTINGLFIDIETASGSPTELFVGTTRFDDTDIVHVLTENVVLANGAGGSILVSAAPSSVLVGVTPLAGASGNVPAGSFTYRLTNVDAQGVISPASDATVPVTLTSTGSIVLSNLPTLQAGDGFVSRQIYRAPVDAFGNTSGPFQLVGTLGGAVRTFTDTQAVGTSILPEDGPVLISRLDASLVIDPGTIIKLDSARIEARFGANIIAEGTPDLPIVFTSLEDQRFGAGGTFNTNNRSVFSSASPGQFGGIFVGQGASASIDHAVIAGAGGESLIEGASAFFNAIEVHQADLRLANSRLEFNATGSVAEGVNVSDGDDRVGRGTNATGTIFVRGSQPIIVGNEFVDNVGAAITADINSFDGSEVIDRGRSSGPLDASTVNGELAVQTIGNFGPLIRDNIVDGNGVNGLIVRGGVLATEGVLDDVDITHVVTDSIEVPNRFVNGGLSLRSDSRGSLVVKLESGVGESAGIVVGGRLLSAADDLGSIADRIGGALHILGAPDFPVVLTALADDTIGGGFDLQGLPQTDTNGDGSPNDADDEVAGTLPTGPEVNNGTLIDNDVDPALPGFFEAGIAAGNSVNASGVTVEDNSTGAILVDQDFIFDYSTLIEFGGTVIDLSATTITQQPTLIAEDVVESRGSFAGPNGLVEWIATSSFVDGTSRLTSRVDLSAAAASTLGDIRVINYLDEDIEGVGDDILVTTGTPGLDDFRAFTLDGPRRVGFSHGGFFETGGDNLVGATFTGWAADQFPQLLGQINAGTQEFSIPGTIDLADLPENPDPDFGSFFGPNDVTTAFAWNTDAGATTATVTAFLELLSIDPVVEFGLGANAGLHNGIVVRELSDDRNVAAVVEQESDLVALDASNNVPALAQFLGELAPNEAAGNENQRLGFIVDGAISQRSDVDVYSFEAEGGTRVYFDIDRTSNSLDTIIELVDINGNVLAGSNDSSNALSTVPVPIGQQGSLFFNPALIDGSAVSPLQGSNASGTGLQDTFSINGKDAGFSVVLPGEIGARGTFTVRVRSADLDSALETSTVVGVGNRIAQGTYSGLSVGSYELQIRLQRADEHAGTVIRQSEVRLATTGLQVIGGPISSALTGEGFETTADNDTIATAQLLGAGAIGNDGLPAGLLSSDRLAQSVSGFIDGTDDVDFYQFDVSFDFLDSFNVTDYLSAVFDLDYASGLGRADLAFYVFDADGTLVLTGDDSNISGDRSPTGVAAGTDVLEGGSFGAADPFIGPAELDAGTYFIAVANATQVPAQLDQFFNADSANPLVRLEPSLSTRRIVEDRIVVGNDVDVVAISSIGVPGGVAEQSILFDPVSSIVPLTLDDLVLYVNTGSSLELVNPFTGQRFGTAGEFSPDGEGNSIAEIAFTNAGDLFGFSELATPDTTDASLSYFQIDPVTGALGAAISTGAGVDTLAAEVNDTPPPFFNAVAADVGISVEAIAIAAFEGDQTGFFVGDRGTPFDPITEGSTADFDTNILFRFDPETGLVDGETPMDGFEINAAATSIFPIGEIDTADDDDDFVPFFDVLGLTAQTRGNGFGGSVADVQPNDFFVISDLPSPTTGASNQVRFEFVAGPTLTASGGALVLDGQGFTVDDDANGLTAFEFNTGPRLQLSDAASVGDPSTDLVQSGSLVNIADLTFEFVRLDETPTAGNVAILLEDELGQPRSGAELATDVAEFVNLAIPGARANVVGDELFFLGSNEPLLALDNPNTNADGLTLLGDSGVSAGTQEIRVDETISAEGLINVIARRLQDNSIDAVVSGDTLSLPLQTSLFITDNDQNQLPPLVFNEQTELAVAGSTPIVIEATDTTETLSQRIIDAINLETSLNNVDAAPSTIDQLGGGQAVTFRSVALTGGGVVAVGSQSGALTSGGDRLGGQVTGIDLVAGGDLFAVTDEGELYRVPQGALDNLFPSSVGQLVETATDLIGIPFESLSVGPNSFGNGELREILFGITGDGTIHAFNTAGELQPIFAGGQTSIQTGINGAQGLDFSTLATNLFHVTDTRGDDAGHGVEAAFNDSRGSVAGESSLAFNFEENILGGQFTDGESPGDEFDQTFNFPGGARGSLESNSFSLEGYVAEDLPFLYFNYFLETDQFDSVDGQVDDDNDGVGDGDTDSLRVFLIAEDGTQHLLATNNTARGPQGNDDEFDDPAEFGIYDDDIDVEVQQLFDSTGTFRQARVDLGDFAGQSGLRLRVEFATSGTSTGSPGLRTVAASELSEGDVFNVNGVNFAIDFAPALLAPSGAELAAAFDAGSARSFSIGETTYVFNDGTGTVVAGPGQESIDVVPGPGIELATLTAGEIAGLIVDAIQTNPPVSSLDPSTTISLQINVVGNAIELVSDEDFSITPTPTAPISVDGVGDLPGVSVLLSRSASAEEVAAAVQQSIASALLAGNTGVIPLTNNSVRLAGLQIGNAGPFVDESQRFGDQFGGGVLAGAANNSFEGVYLDDFIIGFAERGELVTGATAAGDQGFVTDTRPQLTSPDSPFDLLDTAAYTLEIRDASEFVSFAAVNSPIVTGGFFDTRFQVFDTNDQLSDSISITLPAGDSIADGQGFTISGESGSVRFEFDQIGLGVSPSGVPVGNGPSVAGSVPIAFSLDDSATSIAAATLAAINRSDVQSVLGVDAEFSSGSSLAANATEQINFDGDTAVIDTDGVLASIVQSGRRGDLNRERAEGVLIVEQSQFLFNENFGIEIANGETATVAGVETDSIVTSPRNLIELNTENLNPGLVLQNNVLAFNEVGGLRIEGITQLDLTTSNSASLDKIINNTIIGGSVLLPINAPAETFNGIVFEDGQLSFADAVVDFSPDLGENPPTIEFQDSTQILGAPDSLGIGAEPINGDNIVSLGESGSITVQFTDNFLTGSGDSAPDLVVFESGEIEAVRVEVSSDGTNFIDVGIVSGTANTIDLDQPQFGIGAQSRLSFVRLTDLGQGSNISSSIGADIDAVGAISSVSADFFEAGGIGVDLAGNVTPTLLNNVIANSAVAISGSPTGTPFVAGTSFFRNEQNAAGGATIGQFPQTVGDNESLFVDPTNLVFTPGFGTSIIDSGINSLAERSSLTVVRGAVGLNSSPVLAPDVDSNGAFRSDDPFVEPPSGLGDQVFVDRGATDRGDTTGPRAVLLTPQATTIGLESGSVVVSSAPEFFEVQFVDGLAPADVVPGSGIADSTVLSGSVLLIQDGVPLVEGVDYRFGYNATDNIIRLTPVAGVFEDNSVYQIQLIDGSDSILQAVAGDQIPDGASVQLRTPANDFVTLQYDSGITVELSTTQVVAGQNDGLVLTIFDGNRTVNFELDSDNDFDAGNVVVDIPTAAGGQTVFAALANAINAQNQPLVGGLGFNVSAVAQGGSLQLQSSNLFATADSDDPIFVIDGEFGTSVGFGLTVPNELGEISSDLSDGDTFSIRSGSSDPVVFELTNDGFLNDPTAIAITIPAFGGIDALTNNIVAAIDQAFLVLDPVNAGFGRISIGGDATFSIDVTQSALTVNGFPGQTPPVAVQTTIDQTAVEVAQAIADAINSSGLDALSGVTTTINNNQVFLDGVASVIGFGAVDTVTVQDRVGNSIQGNTPGGGTELTIFVGGAFDFGDAPGNFITLLNDTATPGGPTVSGPRHLIVDGFSLGPSVSAEADARVPNADDDNGVRIGTLQTGFLADLDVSISVPQAFIDAGTPFFFDAWFDWNGDGLFSVNEVTRFRSDVQVPNPDPSAPAGSTVPQLVPGENELSVSVPANAVVGSSFARFRLSTSSTLSSIGDAQAGEVEDFPIVINVNAFQNPSGRFDVNGSGLVTPLDALLVINALRRDQFSGDADPGLVQLGLGAASDDLPTFPDVNGDGRVSPIDALLVINELRRQQAEGEFVAPASISSTFAPVASGVLASASTLVGDALIRDNQAASQASVDRSSESTIAPSPSSPISVFDSPESEATESTLEILADDLTSQNADGEFTAIDNVFASLN